MSAPLPAGSKKPGLFRGPARIHLIVAMAMVALALAAAAFGGCSTMFPTVEKLHVQDVRLKFRDRESCGEDQIQITSTPEPDWLKAQRTPPPAPPPEVAADPSRAKVWYDNHPGESYEGYPMYLASGCGHTDLFVCDIRYMCGDVICNHCVYMSPTEPAPASSGGAAPAVANSASL
jgi:hypothetical protein